MDHQQTAGFTMTGLLILVSVLCLIVTGLFVLCAREQRIQRMKYGRFPKASKKVFIVMPDPTEDIYN